MKRSEDPDKVGFHDLPHREGRQMRLRVRMGILAGLFCFFFTPASKAQDSALVQKDSTSVTAVKQDTTQARVHKIPIIHKKKDSVISHEPDTVVRVISPQQVVNMQKVFRMVLAANPYFNFLGARITPYAQIHQAKSFNSLFYFLVGILFFFALLRLLFRKYLANLFTLFFRVSMRQQQIREQVIQSPLPSLLLNGLFIISGGMYAAFLIRHFGFAQKTEFWILMANSAGALLIIYLVKFILLKFSGWIFSVQRATDTYIFIVFLTNKILGIFLLPFLIMLSFSGPLATEVLITLSWIMVLMFFIYRFIVSFGPVRKEIKVSAFHFFLYLCAFEIAPLLLIYKVLLTYLEKAY